MRILFILPDLPYPVSNGGKSKVYNLMSYLSHDHQLDIVCFSDSDNDHLVELKRNVSGIGSVWTVPYPSNMKTVLNTLWNIVSLVPVSLASFWSTKFVSQISSILGNVTYDVVHIDIVNMAQYLPCVSHMPTLHSPNDATSLAYKRLLIHQKWSMEKLKRMFSMWLIRRYERRIYPEFSCVHVVSQDDAYYLKKLCENIHVSAVPIMVDLDDVSVKEKYTVDASDVFRIVCVGNLENQAIYDGVAEILQDIFPKLMDALPEVILTVLGKGACANNFPAYQELINVQLIEWVDDYNQHLSSYDIVLAPDAITAPGVKTRVLNAMIMGLPVVGTPSSFEGLPVHHRQHGFIYHSPQECVNLLIDIAKDRRVCEEIGKNARQLVMGEYALEVLGPRYEKLYLQAIDTYNNKEAGNKLDIETGALVSIILPTYNRAHEIKRAINSILGQTYQNFEVLVIDNHSTDETLEFIQQFNDPRIKIFKVHNQGVIARSRNLGITKATGSYVAFLDSDDWWHREKLSYSVAQLQSGADLVFHDLYIVKQEDSIQQWHTANTHNLAAPVFDDLFLKGRVLNNSSVVVRKHFLDAINGFSENPDLVGAEDLDGWLRIARLTDRFSRIPKTLGYYWLGGGNVTNAERVTMYIKVLIERYSNDVKRLKNVVWLDYTAGRAYYQSGQYQEASRHLRKVKLVANSWKLYLKSKYMLWLMKFSLPQLT